MRETILVLFNFSPLGGANEAINCLAVCCREKPFAKATK